ncbi:hypothetical protein [Psychromonas ingrahamii]|nr:hypothetical protein [Psychromonas ingrahamii]
MIINPKPCALTLSVNGIEPLNAIILWLFTEKYADQPFPGKVFINIATI